VAHGKAASKWNYKESSDVALWFWSVPPGGHGDLATITQDCSTLSAIRVYTRVMKVVKVRRVGNSNVISIPREFEAQGYVPGSSVLVEELPGGELRIMSTEKVRERIRDIGAHLVAEHGEALEILANHDPDAHGDRAYG
jgi:antitoxin component of MazEF toxin-antitoxin module